MCLHCILLIVVGGLYGVVNIFNYFCHLETFRYVKRYIPYNFSKDLKVQSGKGALPDALICGHQRHKK